MTTKTPHWRIGEVCNREVLVLDLKPAAQHYEVDCADCGSPAKQVICEIADDGTPDLSKVWMYCGVCEVG